MPIFFIVCGLALLVVTFLLAFTVMAFVTAILGAACLVIGGVLTANHLFPPRRR